MYFIPMKIKFVIKNKFVDTKFKVGDKVRCNSEAEQVSGTIIKLHSSDFDYNGYSHHATKEEPQFEIKSNKTEHIVAH